MLGTVISSTDAAETRAIHYIIHQLVLWCYSLALSQSELIGVTTSNSYSYFYSSIFQIRPDIDITTHYFHIPHER